MPETDPKPLGLDLQGALEAKLDYNDGRPFRHGGKKA